MSFFFVKKRHLTQGKTTRQMWQLAWPMILANISVPLLGFVDTAVVGHLDSSQYLAGTALASLLVSVLFWLCGFLRMSTTATIAFHSTDANPDYQLAALKQGMLLAVILALFILILQTPILMLLMWLVQPQGMDTAILAAQQYFSIRILAAPLTLMSMVLAGYLIGMGKTKPLFAAVILSNLVNILGDILLVPIMSMGVEGVAYASLAAELCLFALLLREVNKRHSFMHILQSQFLLSWRNMVKQNGLLFLRSALLQGCLTSMAIIASYHGSAAVAMNAILMQLFLFISFSMDGIAYAVESMVGQNMGRQKKLRVTVIIKLAMFISGLCALIYSAFYAIGYFGFVKVTTSLPDIHDMAPSYYLVAALLPLMSYASFILDGVYVGLNKAAAMLYTMAIAASVFGIMVLMLQSLGHLGLWIAFLGFMLARGLSQYLFLPRLLRSSL